MTTSCNKKFPPFLPSSNLYPDKPSSLLLWSSFLVQGSKVLQYNLTSFDLSSFLSCFLWTHTAREELCSTGYCRHGMEQKCFLFIPSPSAELSPPFSRATWTSMLLLSKLWNVVILRLNYNSAGPVLVCSSKLGRRGRKTKEGDEESSVRYKVKQIVLCWAILSSLYSQILSFQPLLLLLL